MGIKQKKKGDPITAEHDREIVDAINQRVSYGTTRRGEYSQAGSPSFNPPSKTLVRLFELTDHVCVPEGWDTDGMWVCERNASTSECAPVEDPDCRPYGDCEIPPGEITRPDVPWSNNAMMVYLDDDRNIYDTLENDKKWTLYFPTATQCADVNRHGPTCRFWCVWNEQSGRWETLTHYDHVCSSSSGSSSSGVSSSSSSSSSSSGSSSSSSSSGVSSSSSSSSGVSSSSSSSSSGVSSSSSSSSGSSSSSSSGSSSGPCETCFEGLCLEDIPTVASLSEGDFVLAIQDGCLVKVAVTDCTSSSSGA